MAHTTFCDLSAAHCGIVSLLHTSLRQTEISSSLSSLLQNMDAAEAMDDALLTAKAYHENVLSDMERIRSAVNEAEALIPDQYLSYPTYDQLLFSI